MFRLLVGALALFGLASLLFGTAGAAAGFGLLVLAPLFLFFKFLFFVALIGFFVKGFGRWHRPRSRYWSAWEGPEWMRRDRRPGRTRESIDQDRFQEWHDLEHARREVDSWTSYDL